MRIAVSGTHCSGKSTLIEDFLAVHGDYVHEPEPYDWLEELGEALDFQRQLEVCVERLRGYGPGARMIAERSPVDFLAYLSVAGEPIESAIELAAQGMEHIDLLVVLTPDGIDAPEEEDLELREAMNERLLEIVATDEFELFAGAGPRVIEASGSRARRLETVERAMEAFPTNRGAVR